LRPLLEELDLLGKVWLNILCCRSYGWQETGLFIGTDSRA
jgi:hypothetical protein